jgi:hypothetical protein
MSTGTVLVPGSLASSVADPDAGSEIRCLFSPCIRDPGWVKNQDTAPGSGSGMNFQSRIIFLGA